MDRLGLIDAGFWSLEDDHASLHIGSVTVFDGPPPDFADVLNAIECKLPQLPRYRKKLRSTPFGLARPVWIDDSDFALNFHVRHTALPRPGGEEQLRALVERLMSQRMDIDHPLWEAWLVEGLSDGQWAMVWKLHHSLVDGVGGMALLATMLDAAPDAVSPPAQRWTPRAEPSSLHLARSAVQDRVRANAHAGRAAFAAVRRPASTLRTISATLLGVARYATAARPVARSSLVGELDSSRRIAWVTAEIADVSTVRQAFGGSLNDVVLAMVTRGFRDLLLAHHENPQPRTVRSLVPVSVRSAGAPASCDNHISALLADLPTHLEEPVAALQTIVAHTKMLKSSHEAEAGELVIGLASRLPDPAITASLRAAFRVPQRFISTVTTNVPGPRWPLYLLGRRMIAMFPYVPIADQIRVGVAVTSYDGRLYFGITSDRDSVPDVEVLAAGIAAGLQDLCAAAAVPSAR